MTLPAPSSSLLDFALYYASRGWPVFPVHSIVADKCTCGSYSCGSPGKHPHTERGLSDASTEPEVIRAWWRRWPKANIALRTGNGLVVIDVDPRHGGTEGLASAEQEHGALPATLESLTGGGGRHLLFSVTQEVRNSAQKIAPGVDIRGDGGYIVAPPSNHSSGGTYTWLTAAEPAPLPEWCLTASKRSKQPLQPLPDKVIQGARNETLFTHAAKLRSQGFEYEEIFAALKALNENRCRPMLDTAEVHTIANSACRYPAGVNLNSGQTQGAPVTNDDLWRSHLICNLQGHPKKTTVNVGIYLAHDKEWKGKLIYDEFANRYLWTQQLPAVGGMKSPQPGEAEDHHYSYVQQWLLQNTQTLFTEAMVCSGISSAARQRSVHPVREYLTTLPWDRVPRVPRWLSTYLGVPDTPYARLVGKWWMISAVARIFEPGAKVDSLLIFEGAQGKGKSQAVEVLVGKQWFSDTPLQLGNKDAYINIQGLWVCELGELMTLKSASANAAKTFFSSRVDRFRMPFERATRSFPRQCVFIGTTNEDEYLVDPTGGRRFWPIRCGAIDLAGLARDRDQLWAEAVSLYERENRWWPKTDEEVSLCRAEQEQRYVGDPWEDVIYEFLQTRETATIAHILQHIGVPKDRWDQNTQQRVTACLKRLQWDSKPEWLDGKTQRVFRSLHPKMPSHTIQNKI